MSGADWVLLAIVALAAGAALYYIRRAKKQGRCIGCSGGCAGCGSCPGRTEKGEKTRPGEKNDDGGAAYRRLRK